MFNDQTFQIFLFLIPGLIASVIMNAMVVRKNQSQLTKLIEALIFSLLIYVTFSGFAKNGNIFIISDFETPGLIYEFKSLIGILLLSLFYGVLFGGLIHYDVLLNCLRTVKLTKKTAESSVWYDVFKKEKCYIVINFVDGYRLKGYPRHFSDDPDKPYIYLQDSSWVVYNKKTKKQTLVPLNRGEIFITPEMKIEYIEFLNQDKKQSLSWIKKLFHKIKQLFNKITKKIFG